MNSSSMCIKLRRLSAGIVPLISAASISCATNLSQVDGVRAVAPSPSVPWTAPREALKREAPVEKGEGVVPADLAQRIQQLTLADVVDLALRNNPATRASWAQARVAANVLGSTRGDYFPTINGSYDATRSHSPVTAGRVSTDRTQYGPALNLNYLLFDFGGRSASVETAKQNLF